MIIESAEELEKLHSIGLEMLIELDRICRKNDIKYSLDGGTLLGAIRHKGFIPWDDDVDVIMLRHEYAKFRRACIKDLDKEKFFLQDYTTDKNYRWGYAKMRRRGTSFIRKGQERLRQQDGVFMDIFVVDRVPDVKPERAVHHFLCYLIRKGLYSELGKTQSTNIASKLLFAFVSKIPRDFFFKLRNRLAKYTNAKYPHSELISHYTYEYPKRCQYGLPGKCFDKFIETEFEGRKFFIFEEFDIYLSKLYGNYMELPPPEKRKPHLELSRLDFGEE